MTNPGLGGDARQGAAGGAAARGGSEAPRGGPEADPATSQSPTLRARVRRHPERARYDRQVVNAILDEALICHLGFVDDGAPFVIPTMYARAGESLYVHGSPASRMLKTAAAGVDLCVTVTLLDGLVLARSVFNHSLNYRSAVILGRATEVTGPAEKMAASRALVEHVCPGRWAEARPPSAKELAATLIVKIDLGEASAKIRTGGPKDKEEDLDLPIWAGEVPFAMRALRPVGHEALPPGTHAPGYVTGYLRPGWSRPA